MKIKVEVKKMELTQNRGGLIVTGVGLINGNEIDLSGRWTYVGFSEREKIGEGAPDNKWEFSTIPVVAKALGLAGVELDISDVVNMAEEKRQAIVEEEKKNAQLEKNQFL